MRLLQVLHWQEGQQRQKAEPDCHSAIPCTDSAMTLVTALCPFQRAKGPLQRDYGQEDFHTTSPSFSAAGREAIGGLVDLA